MADKRERFVGAGPAEAASGEVGQDAPAAPASTESSRPLQCGLVMPISTIDGLGPEHWLEVKAIISDAVEGIVDPKFTVRLVSDAADAGLIHKRIVQNLYSDDIIVCDVSGKNPNVLFELGMRLAFDKPAVIVKDDRTDYTFDTGGIEHVAYPRDLRFGRVVEFKDRLASKVMQTHRAAQKEGYSPFLGTFGQFRVAQLHETPVPAGQYLVDGVDEIRRLLGMLLATKGRAGGGLPPGFPTVQAYWVGADVPTPSARNRVAMAFTEVNRPKEFEYHSSGQGIGVAAYGDLLTQEEIGLVMARGDGLVRTITHIGTYSTALEARLAAAQMGTMLS